MEFCYPKPAYIIGIQVNVMLSSSNLNLLVENEHWRMKHLLQMLRVALKEWILISSNLNQHLLCQVIS
jgi:hypothetical protein